MIMDSRLQVDLDHETLKVLDELMLLARNEEGNRKIGTSTMAARLLTALAARPDLIRQLLKEASKDTAPQKKAAGLR